MAIICPLSSGSSGNATLIHANSTTILVDAGSSCKAICAALQECEFSHEDLDAILLTHEHSDHIKALPVLLKKINVPIYATQAVLEYLVHNVKIPSNIPLVPLENKPFAIHDLEVTSFVTPHDSVGSVGYRITTEDGKKIGIATDLGHMTQEILDHLSSCHAVLLESNYDDGMLLCSPYPYSLKRRIMSQRGHLSNDDCAKAAVHLARSGVQKLILGHLSQNNNLPELAFSATQNALNECGCLGVELQMAKRSECSKPVLL